MQQLTRLLVYSAVIGSWNRWFSMDRGSMHSRVQTSTERHCGVTLKYWHSTRRVGLMRHYIREPTPRMNPIQAFRVRHRPR
jgi:hypothetical protein